VQKHNYKGIKIFNKKKVMSETQRIFNVKPTYYPKAYIKAEKIEFGEYTDQATGEIRKKEFQVCLYVPEGQNTPYMPNVCFGLKLGNSNFTLFAEDLDSIKRAVEGIQNYLVKVENAGALTKKLLESRSNYIKKLTNIVNSNEIK